jgi:hypothetical protein
VVRSSRDPCRAGLRATGRGVVAARCEQASILPVRRPRTGHQGPLGTTQSNESG